MGANQEKLTNIDALSWGARHDCLAPQSEWAWQNFKNSVVQLTALYEKPRVMEIGAGRNPLFSTDEVAELGIEYILNDVSERELSLAEIDSEKICYDFASGDGIPAMTPCDVVFSKMVLEHVESGEAYYKNILSLLNPGGVVLSFYPTLFSPPFLINWLLPEALSTKILEMFFPIRNDNTPYPKFPAKYSWCYSTQKLQNRISNLGFSCVFVVPFYGHNYFEVIPIMRSIDRTASNVARRARFRSFSSYAYSICFK